jgi:hypothetical protein
MTAISTIEFSPKGSLTLIMAVVQVCPQGLIFKKRSAGVGFFENTNLFPHDPMLKNW